MIKRIGLAVLICLVVPCIALANQIKDQVVDPYVEVRQDEGRACGSGTVINLDGTIYVLTAGHVVRDLLVTDTKTSTDRNGKTVTESAKKWKPAHLYKETSDGKRAWDAEVVWFSDVEEYGGHDLALLKPKNCDGLKAAKVCWSVKFDVGDDVWYIGTPSGLHQSLEKTIVNQVANDPQLKNPYTFINGNGWFGNSGGGMFVFDGHNFILAGVVVRLATDSPRSPIMCQTQSTIETFLKDFQASLKK